MTTPSLAELRDIHLPPPPWPAALLDEQASALALIAALAGALLAWSWRRWTRRRLHAALRELARLAGDHRRHGDTTRLVRGLSHLLRQHAIARFPATDAAGLVGDAWLCFLDAHGGGGAFGKGVGSVLASRPYRADGDVDVAALIDLVRRWLQANPA